MVKADWIPWRDVVTVRDDVKSGDLSLARFAADLYDVVLGRGPIQYRDPGEFFSLTYPTFNLRELVKDVVLRLDGKTDKAIRQLELTYGGGKTHTLITLYQLVHQPDSLPDLPAVREFREHAGVSFPAARVACLPFDKLDVEKGMEIADQQGQRRWLKQPWSLLAYQLAGDAGLALLHAEGLAEERDSAPAENLMTELLAMPSQEGLATLILLDEVLMYVREKVADDPASRGRMQNFFQYLTQAVTKVPRCALVVSLLASDPRKNDAMGKELSGDLAEIFRREQDHSIQPVGKDDVAEILRRQFFTPGSIRERERFRAPVVAALKGISGLDEGIRKDGGQAEERYLNHYPFHPDLTDVFYTKWTQLEGFQRTRGILRTFALALRDAVQWDAQPLISTNVLLAEPGSRELSAATRELATVAATEEYEAKRQEWLTILQGELEKAQRIQEDFPALQAREIEQAVCATFLHSQPIGQRATTRELAVLLGAARPDRIELEKALRQWADTSWFLDEAALTEGQGAGATLPSVWRLGSRPNLKQMHNDARARVASSRDGVQTRLIDEIKSLKSLTTGAAVAGATVHVLPKQPADIADDGAFHYAVLGPEAASASGNPSTVTQRFLEETTTMDRPRVHRNAVVLVTMERTALAAVREQIEVALAWDEVESQLKHQDLDPLRERLLKQYQSDARHAIPPLVQQSYSIVVSLSKEGKPWAFKMTVDATRPLFEQIKHDERSRIQDAAISAEAILPGGPYDLWKPGDTARRLKDLVGAFADVPALPKMLRAQGIWDTVRQGMQEGLVVLRAWRPDHTFRTWWRESIHEDELTDSTLEVVLPETAELEHVNPDLLIPGYLPGLWSSAGTITLADLERYFNGTTVAEVVRHGYTEPVSVPRVSESVLVQAVKEAVERGRMWAVNGMASLWGEPVPDGVLTANVQLHPSPEPLGVFDVLAEQIPDVWKDASTTALAISIALSNLRGQPLPWSVVRQAITEARSAGLITIDADNVSWPCALGEAGKIRIQRVQSTGISPPPRVDQSVRTERALKPSEFQNMAEVIGDVMSLLREWSPVIRVTVEFNEDRSGGGSAIRAKLNTLLNSVSDGWQIK